MYVKRVAAVAAIASGVGMAAMTFGVGLVNAAPLDPPPCENCQSGPDGAGAGPGGNPTPPAQPKTHIPCIGAGPPMGGGGAHPCFH